MSDKNTPGQAAKEDVKFTDELEKTEQTLEKKVANKTEEVSENEKEKKNEENDKKEILSPEAAATTTTAAGEDSGIDKNDAESDSGSDTSEKPPPGLFEQPLVLEQGTKRSRQATQRFSVKVNEEFASRQSMEFPEGHGVALGEIESISDKIRRKQPPALKFIHRVIFGRDGVATEVKQNLRKFRGFSFDENSAEFTKKLNWTKTRKVSELKDSLELLGIEGKGNREELGERLIKFLLNPHENIATKTKESSTELSKKKEKTSTPSKKRASAAVDGNESPRKRKKTTATNKQQQSKKVKLDLEEKDDEKKEDKEEEGSGCGSEIVKEKLSFPSDSEIRKRIEAFLKESDLNEITMKTVMDKMAGIFSQFDLSAKKPMMKAIVKEALNQSS